MKGCCRRGQPYKRVQIFIDKYLDLFYTDTVSNRLSCQKAERRTIMTYQVNGTVDNELNMGKRIVLAQMGGIQR